MKLRAPFWLAAFCVYALPTPGYTDAADPAAIAPVERLRRIPDHAYKGVMWPVQDGQVRINDDNFKLAPGLTIRDMNNRIVLPSSVRRPKKVRYTLDMYGQVRRIWISPTGEYMGRHLPADPPGGRRNEDSDGSTDESSDGSTLEDSDESTDDSADSPDS